MPVRGFGKLPVMDNTSQGSIVIRAAVWLRDDARFILLDGLDHTPRPGEVISLDGRKWRVIVWTDRIECEMIEDTQLN
jgi:hypothetical protein